MNVMCSGDEAVPRSGTACTEAHTAASAEAGKWLQRCRLQRQLEEYLVIAMHCCKASARVDAGIIGMIRGHLRIAAEGAFV